MANRIQKDYRSHMQGTSPDMDKLWNRIEQRIDNSQAAAAKAETGSADEQQKITVSKGGGWIKYAAVAACLIAVVVGTVTFMNSKEEDIKTDTSSSYSSKAGVRKTLNYDGVSEADEQKNNETKREDIAEESQKDYVAGKTTEAAGLAPNEQVKALMRTAEYEAADKDKRVELVENLAKEMKEKGEILKYEIFRRDSGDRIELTLPDELVKGIILK
ncbi:MAG: anti-sigma factor [Ruminococcus sp.]|nr:anti-sigma factor [Ruminococcus sp.]